MRSDASFDVRGPRMSGLRGVSCGAAMLEGEGDGVRVWEGRDEHCAAAVRRVCRYVNARATVRRKAHRRDAMSNVRCVSRHFLRSLR